MKILVFGVNGQVGNAIYLKLKYKYKNYKINYCSSTKLSKKIKKINFLNLSSVTKIIRAQRPDIIINASAYTNVDMAEVEKKKSFKINAKIPQLIAEEAKKQNSFFIHFSTDYIFNGTKKKNYTENCKGKPINYYGETKLYAENAILKSGCSYLILRLSSVYGYGKKNFIKKIINNLKQNKIIKVVDDQFGNLTSCELIVSFLLVFLKNFSKKKIKSDIFNLCCKNSCSRIEVARYILKNYSFFKNKNVYKILPIKSFDLKSLASRPMNTSLNVSKIEKKFRLTIRDWKFYLYKYLKKI